MTTRRGFLQLLAGAALAPALPAAVPAATNAEAVVGRLGGFNGFTVIFPDRLYMVTYSTEIDGLVYKDVTSRFWNEGVPLSPGNHIMAVHPEIYRALDEALELWRTPIKRPLWAPSIDAMMGWAWPEHHPATEMKGIATNDNHRPPERLRPGSTGRYGKLARHI